MNILIKIGENIIELVLEKEGGEILDNYIFPEKNNLSEELLTQIDNFLAKNNLNIKEIDKFEVKSEISDKFTTVKIAQTVANSLNYAKTVN